MLAHIDGLSAQIEMLTSRLDELIAELPAAQAALATGESADAGEAISPLLALARLDEVPGVGRAAAQSIIAEVGLDMSRFPTAAHLVAWARLSPRTIQSGSRSCTGRTGKGNPYLKRVLGEVAAAAARTDSFLGQRYRRLARRRGRIRALVALARSILVIVWHLLTDPAARFIDLGPDFYERRIDTERRTRNLVRQLQALGRQVTLSLTA